MAVWNSINYTDIRPDRFDAEYFQPLYRINLKELKSTSGCIQLGELFAVIDRGEKAEYVASGTIPVLRSVNIRELSFNDQRQEFVSKEYFDKKAKGQVKKGDILITSTGTGTLGRTSIWYREDDAFNVPENSFLRGPYEVNPYFVAAYLNTKYGVLQLFQNQRGSSGQLHLYPIDIKRVLIPEFLFAYQEEIGAYLTQAFELREQSQSLYRQAEELLSKELQLDKITLSAPKWYTAGYCEIVKDSRFDGEYFSPVVKNILSQSFLDSNYTIGKIFNIVRGSTPKSYQKEGIPVIKTRNVRTPDIDRKRINDYSSAQYTTVLTQEDDLVIAAMGVGSLGRLSYITAENSCCTIDGTLRIFRKKDDSIENIEIPTMLFLSSEIGQRLIYRGVVGSTGIISVTDDYLANIPIPLVEESLRKQLTELVKKSIQAQSDSMKLLTQAKNRIEELIEQKAGK